MIVKKQRLDQILFNRNLAESKTKAQAIIMAGQVFVDGKNINKSGTYIVSGTQQYTVDQLFNILFEIAGKKKKVKYLKKISDDHYGLTPFRFIPEKSEKIILNEFKDLGEGLLEAFHENFKK